MKKWGKNGEKNEQKTKRGREKKEEERNKTKSFPLLKPISELASSRECNFTPNGDQTLT